MDEGKGVSSPWGGFQMRENWVVATGALALLAAPAAANPVASFSSIDYRAGAPGQLLPGIIATPSSRAFIPIRRPCGWATTSTS